MTDLADSRDRRDCLYPGHPASCTPWHYATHHGGRKMVTRVLAKVWEHRHSETVGTDLAVLLTIAAHVGQDATVPLDYEALAGKTGMSLQQAIDIVERLLHRRELIPAGDGWVAVSLNGAVD